MSIMGCAIATGVVYASLVRGMSSSPEQEEAMFNYATLGFAFVETFMFVMIGGCVILGGY